MTATFSPDTIRELIAMYFGQWLGELHIRDDVDNMKFRASAIIDDLEQQAEAHDGLDVDAAARCDAAIAFLAHLDELDALEENERQWEAEQTDTITARNIDAGHTLNCPACRRPIEALTLIRDATVAFTMSRLATPLSGVWKPETPAITYLDETEALAYPCNCTLTTHHAELVAAALEERRAFRMRPE